MEIEDGVIWVYGAGEDGVMAFTDFGIENLIEHIKMHKGQNDQRGGPRRMLTLNQDQPGRSRSEDRPCGATQSIMAIATALA